MVTHTNAGFTEREAHNVVFSDKGWRLCIYDGNTPSWLHVQSAVYLHHRCEKHGFKTATRDDYAGMRFPCSWCNREVPKSVQALYVMMTGDMES